MSETKNPSNLITDEDKIREYYTNLTRLRCCGDKCRINASYGYGFHCVDCYGEIDEEDYLPYVPDTLSTIYPTIVNCHPNRHGHIVHMYGCDVCADIPCRLDGTRGIYCEDCSGEYNEEEYHEQIDFSYDDTTDDSTDDDTIDDSPDNM